MNDASVADPSMELLPGVPAVESPFFDRFFAEGTCEPETLKVAREMRRHGYAVIDFPDPEVHARAERIKQHLRDCYDWEAWRSGREKSLRLQDAWLFDADVKAIATNPAVLKLLSTLYRRRAFPFQTLNFPVGTQQAAHSDAVHFNSSPERFMCGVWVALEDMDANNGPLIYYPGSHHWPVFSNAHLGVNCLDLPYPYANSQQFQAAWSALAHEQKLEPQRFCAKAGQALIWTANLLHGGDRQVDQSRTRWSQVTHYYFDHCVYYTPLDSDPFFGRILFREPMDITTGQVVHNHVGTRRVPPEFVSASLPKPAGRPHIDRSQPALLPADFDPEAYLKFNPDVAAAGVDARRHYLEFGAYEARRWR